MASTVTLLYALFLLLMNTTPFTVFEAQVGLWTTDASGNPASVMYLGAAVERVTMQEQVKTRLLMYPGRPTAQDFMEDADYAIELRNVWLLDRSTGVARMPAPYLRNIEFILVIVWFDPEQVAWCNRTFTGVTGRGRTIEAENTYQSIKYRAETLYETAGLGQPVVQPLIYGQINYVDEGNSQPLYVFSSQTATMEPIDPAQPPLTAEINYAVPGQCGISFAGARGPVLIATAAGLTVTGIVALNATFVDQEPRLEFWLNNTRVASLSSAGVLAVANISEASGPPGGGIQVSNGSAWLFTLTAAGAFARTFNELT